MAFVIGLHRDINYLCPDRNEERRREERRITFWCLAFWESWTAFISGRPSSINREEILCPYPASQMFVQMLGRLAMIMLKAKSSIYGQDRISVLGLWRAARSLHAEYLDFSRECRGVLGIDLYGGVYREDTDIKQIYLTDFYQHALMLTFKPFLIVHVLMQKPPAASFIQEHRASHVAPGDMAWLAEAYIIRNTHYLNLHMVAVNAALACLSNFSDTKIAPRVKFTIEKLRDKITDFAKPKECQSSLSPTEGLDQELTVRRPKPNDKHLEEHTEQASHGIQSSPHAASASLAQFQLPDESATLASMDYERVLLRTGDYNIGFEAAPAEFFSFSGLDAAAPLYEDINFW
ncbi:hypothetical protein AbraIFM66950_005504 [Aspergillus brasiliensis]|nr:hypothetical protein AbraIFM66950_005504 [Aspergillus brasiliensis]